MVDLRVYERAGDAVRHHQTLYENLDTRLVFTYPPFAALVAVVVTPFTGWFGQFVWTVSTVTALAGVIVLSFRPLIERCPVAWRPLSVGALIAVALLTHPLVEHVFYGQVNVFLVLLCLADLLARRRRWPHGALIGIASALKLTPAVFGVHLWITGRRRAAMIALGAALACTLLAVIVLPSASMDFWTREIYEGQRVAGSVSYTSNQSLLGLVARVVPGVVGTGLWLVLAVAVGVVGFARTRAAFVAGDEHGAIGLTALLAVLLSPVAWIHHLVWLIPAVGALVADGRDRRRVLAALAVTGLLLLRLPWWGWSMLDEGVLLAPFAVLMHNSYVLIALGLLLAYPIRSEVSRSSASGAVETVASGH
jgi:alpha-1,2-mannosyltransferase